MEIEFDASKRGITLAERGLDFADAHKVFAGLTFPRRMTARTTAKRESSRWECSMRIASYWFGRHAVLFAASSA